MDLVNLLVLQDRVQWLHSFGIDVGDLSGEFDRVLEYLKSFSG